MPHTVSGLVRKPPFIKDGCGQDGQSRMYAVELSEMTKDYQTGEKQYANYKALFFAKTEAAKGYYDQAIAEGSFIVVSCDKLKIEQREHEGRTYVSLQMDNARLDGAHFEQGAHMQQGQPQGYGQPHPQQQPAPQQGYAPQQGQPQQPAPRQRPASQSQAQPQTNQGHDPSFDDEIPFAPIGLQYPALLLCC